MFAMFEPQPPIEARFEDLQQRAVAIRDSFSLRRWRMTSRRIQETLAVVRGINDPLYYKELDTQSFHFPNGVGHPSIWANRPLWRRHCWYAASDVVALFMIYHGRLNLVSVDAGWPPPPPSTPSEAPFESPPSTIVDNVG